MTLYELEERTEPEDDGCMVNLNRHMQEFAGNDTEGPSMLNGS